MNRQELSESFFVYVILFKLFWWYLIYMPKIGLPLLVHVIMFFFSSHFLSLWSCLIATICKMLFIDWLGEIVCLPHYLHVLIGVFLGEKGQTLHYIVKRKISELEGEVVNISSFNGFLEEHINEDEELRDVLKWEEGIQLRSLFNLTNEFVPIVKNLIFVNLSFF